LANKTVTRSGDDVLPLLEMAMVVRADRSSPFSDRPEQTAPTRHVVAAWRR
jgi:hypothetical protein